MAETVIKDTGLCKSVLIQTILDNSEIMEVLLGKEYEKKYTQDEIDDTVYKQIFPYLYIDETQTQTLSYICCEVETPRIPTGTIKDMMITIWVFCHKGIMKYSKKGYRGTRVDILCDMIERSLRYSDKFGIGKLHLSSVEHFFPNSKTYGKQMIYTISDFKIKDN